MEQDRRRESAAAVVELRRSRRRAVERGQRRRARAPAGHGEAICVPGRAGGQAEEAVDDGVSSDGSGERRLGVEAIPAKGGAGVGSAPVSG